MEKKGDTPLVVKQTVDASGAKSPIVKPVQEFTQNNYNLNVKPTINLDGKPINGGARKLIALGISTAVSIYSVGYLHGYANGYKTGKATGEEEEEKTEADNASDGKKINGGGEVPQKINGFVNNPFY